MDAIFNTALLRPTNVIIIGITALLFAALVDSISEKIKG